MASSTVKHAIQLKTSPSILQYNVCSHAHPCSCLASAFGQFESPAQTFLVEKAQRGGDNSGANDWKREKGKVLEGGIMVLSCVSNPINASMSNMDPAVTEHSHCLRADRKSVVEEIYCLNRLRL